MIFKRQIRTRIAPSPTGPLHIGVARTALFNFLFAKKNKGKFVLRIEDTDLKRSDPRFETDIREGLKWLGLDWDEGPYRQSERIRDYKKFLEKLLKKRKAFWCSHSQKELAKEREEQMQKKETVAHFCSFREGESSHGIIRFKNDLAHKEIKFHDLIRGEVGFKAGILGDFSIAKDLDSPLYNFVVVVDDNFMKISHVIRGEDHISNTPKQILIQQALGMAKLKYAHLPLILNKDHSKLSKRNAVVSVNEYRRQGYLPEAFLNFMALLGWRPAESDREVFSLRELIKQFSLDRVQKGGAVFDLEKLNWLNADYIKKLSFDDLEKKLLDYLPQSWQEKIKQEPGYWKKIVELEKPRLVKLADIKENTEYFFEKPHYPKELLLWKDQKRFSEVYQHLLWLLKMTTEMEAKDFIIDKLRERLMPYAEKQGRGNVLWPFRVALTGKRFSPDPFELAEVLGREKTLKRLNWAIELVRNS